MPEGHQKSVGVRRPASAGVPRRWLTLWERDPGDQPALLDAAFIRKSMTYGGHDGSPVKGSGRLPQG